MIACVYGRGAEAFVAPAIADLQAAAAERGVEVAALSIERAVRAENPWESVERIYILPFEVPPRLPAALPLEATALLRALFPRAAALNPPLVHEICWDKLAMARRLLERGIPMPESIITGDPGEARDFVHRHDVSILKDPRACGGHGDVVLCADRGGAIAGEVQERRYAVELAPAGLGRTLAGGVLTCPPPFYLQRLVTAVGRGNALQPAQLLRAYVVGGQVTFWTERYRSPARRLADFIVTVPFGAKYRFLRTASTTAHTLACRAAEVVGARVAAVDLIRTGDEGPFVLSVCTDGAHMMIDRSFKLLPEYRAPYDLDRYIAEALVAPDPPPPPPVHPQRRPRRRAGDPQRPVR